MTTYLRLVMVFALAAAVCGANDQPLSLSGGWVCETPSACFVRYFAENGEFYSVVMTAKGRSLFEGVGTWEVEKDSLYFTFRPSSYIKNSLRILEKVTRRSKDSYVFKGGPTEILAFDRIEPVNETRPNTSTEIVGAINLSKQPVLVSVMMPQMPVFGSTNSVAAAIIAIDISKEGGVVDCRIVAQTSRGIGHVALWAARQWKFSPGEVNGMHVACRILKPIVIDRSYGSTYIPGTEDIRF